MLEKDTFLWVYATGKKSSSHVQYALLEEGRVLGDSDGMEINDAVQHCAVLLLQLHPALNGAKVIAQVGDSCWLDAREHALHTILLQQGKEKQT